MHRICSLCAVVALWLTRCSAPSPGYPRTACGYRCAKAYQRAQRLARKAYVAHKKIQDNSLWDQVVEALRGGLSTEQASGILQRMPGAVQLSAGTNYTALCAMPRGGLHRRVGARPLGRQPHQGCKKPVTDRQAGRTQDLAYRLGGIGQRLGRAHSRALWLCAQQLGCGHAPEHHDVRQQARDGTTTRRCQRATSNGKSPADLLAPSLVRLPNPPRTISKPAALGA